MLNSHITNTHSGFRIKGKIIKCRTRVDCKIYVKRLITEVTVQLKAA